MLWRRSSIWTLVLILGSVLAKNVGTDVVNTDETRTKTETKRKTAETYIEKESEKLKNLKKQEKEEKIIKELIPNLSDVIKNVSVNSSIPLELSSPPTSVDLDNNETVNSRNFHQSSPPPPPSALSLTTTTTTTTLATTKAVTTVEPIPQIQAKTGVEMGRKGTIQLVLNAPATKYPSHYYTTPYPHTHPPYYHHHHYYRPPYPPSSYHEYPPYYEPTYSTPTTSRPYPTIPGFYPGGGIGGGFFPGGGMGGMGGIGGIAGTGGTGFFPSGFGNNAFGGFTNPSLGFGQNPFFNPFFGGNFTQSRSARINSAANKSTENVVVPEEVKTSLPIPMQMRMLTSIPENEKSSISPLLKFFNFSKNKK